MSKTIGTPIASFHGLDIYATSHPSKTGKGKNRLWLEIKQNAPKKWRTTALLCSPRTCRVEFES